MEALTAKQQEILTLIRQAIETTGLPPTRAEIAEAMDYSSHNAAEEHLRMLERKGAIEIVKGSARGIRLKDGGGIPLIGRVAAGSPILAEEHVQAHYQIDPALFNPRADYSAQGARHEHARCRHSRWRPARRAQDQRSPRRAGRGRAP